MEAQVQKMKDEYKALINKWMDTTSTQMFNSFARLLFFDTKSVWRDTYIFGPIAIIMDRVAKAPKIKIFNPEVVGKQFDTIFEWEIYVNFSDDCTILKSDESHIVSFIYNKRHFGLEFPLEKEWRFFISKIKAVEVREEDKKNFGKLLKMQEENIKKSQKKGNIYS